MAPKPLTKRFGPVFYDYWTFQKHPELGKFANVFGLLTEKKLSLPLTRALPRTTLEALLPDLIVGSRSALTMHVHSKWNTWTQLGTPDCRWLFRCDNTSGFAHREVLSWRPPTLCGRDDAVRRDSEIVMTMTMMMMMIMLLILVVM